MKILQFFLFVVLFTFITSCSSDVIHEYQSVGNEMVWGSDETFSFEFEITEEEQYDVTVLLRYVSGCPYENINLKVKWAFDGEYTEYDPISIAIRDKNGKHIGDPSLDFWDVEKVYVSNVNLVKGKYTFDFEHNMPTDLVPFISEIGLKVTVAK